MNITDEEKQKRWVIGVSGGADSMALLAKCIALHMDVVVAHMNYQKRASALRDMQGVQAFCASFDIPCEIYMQDAPCVGNFQAFAREKRYAMYYEVIQKYQGYGVLIAHHMDDHLETYIMQKKRTSVPSYYGIKRNITISKCHVVRPLLDECKAELESYCDKHQIPYFLDESNLSNDYTRNHIRHTYIDSMSDIEKQNLNEEIKEANIKQALIRKQVDEILSTWQKDVDTILKLPMDVAKAILRKWVFLACHIHISQKECDTIYRLLVNEANQWTRYVNEGYDVAMQYGVLSIQKQQPAFSFTYDELQFTKTPYFKLVEKGAVIEGISLSKSDFPITIRSFRQGDTIKLRFGTKKVNRFFIDHKIPQEKRVLWPIVVNAQGQIIFVPKIGCDISHFSNNPNLFVLK